jgi:hypothetical protein
MDRVLSGPRVLLTTGLLVLHEAQVFLDYGGNNNPSRRRGKRNAVVRVGAKSVRSVGGGRVLVCRQVQWGGVGSRRCVGGGRVLICRRFGGGGVTSGWRVGGPSATSVAAAMGFGTPGEAQVGAC